MAELKPFEVIMKINFAGSNGLEIVAHAEKVAELVRCGDCKHRPMLKNPIGKQYGFNVIAPEDKDGWEDNTCPYLVDDGFYSRYPNDTDFCSYAER